MGHRREAALIRTLLEIAVDSLASAEAASRGGADRLELCADLAHGGTTPDIELTSATLERVNIPVFVMIRPRPGNFVYTSEEIAVMQEQMEHMRAAGVHGFVTGVLTKDDLVDVDIMRSLISSAGGLPVTFHRALDRTPDMHVSLDRLIDLGVARVLTSGGAASAEEGIAQLRALVEQANDRIAILAGGGVREGNVRHIIEATGVREVHTQLRESAADVVDESRVRTFIANLRENTYCRVIG